VAVFAEALSATDLSDEVRSRMRTLARRYRSEAADGFAGEFDVSVDGRAYRVTVGEGRCSVEDGRPAFPTARIATDAGTWLELDAGTVSSIEAFLEGRIEVRGNIDHAVRMQSLFRPSARARTPRDLEHVEVQVGKHVLSCFDLGEGPPVLLLHGMGATKLSWMPLLAPLAERYRVIAPDLPGHGESAKPRASYGPRFYASVVRRLLDESGATRAALIGNSLGGRIALEVAARNPGRVRALALLAPAVAGLPFPSYARLLRLVPTELGAIPLPMRRRLFHLGIKQLFAHPERLPRGAYVAAIDEFIRVYRSGRARMALLASMRGLVRDRPDLFWGMVRRVSVPTLVVQGELDRLVPARLGRVLASTMPRAELALLPGVGHVPQFEVPDVTAGVVRTFLDEVYVEEGSRTRKRAPRGSFAS
jgi:pimeloyl-ACP methyl ester carboxylesterase